ncbi:HTH-type transcriptional activator AaeR [Saliniradius amylolyticus]|uniref:HTH-type transcriptional activator AaeR n=1 Tax=Saliniradius amylolyticus TaxID=2183582 RepID=A0A2S2E4A5_9ALTE|nr:LysR family transcriptional regulator [Saliniradius amylolyticus]AWL12080.1 HTH-type transcriptional activator AaeR [Saliniradius amylolyticus]
MFQHLSDMAIFARVIEMGSFTAASDDLQLSKGAVSKAVGRLEKHLSIRLLTRTTRSLSLTSEGEQFYQHCACIVREAELAQEHLASLKTEPEGKVTISASDNFGATRVAPLLPSLLERYPKLSVDLQLSNEIVDMVKDGVDIAIRCGQLKDSNLYFRPLKPLEIVLAASKTYLDKAGRPKHPQELARSQGKHQCLTNGASARFKRWRFYKGSELIEVSVDGRLSISDDRALLHALRQHKGLAFMPRYALQKYIENGELETALPDYMPQPVPMYLVYPERRYKGAGIQACLDHLEKHLGRGGKE